MFERTRGVPLTFSAAANACIVRRVKRPLLLTLATLLAACRPGEPPRPDVDAAVAPLPAPGEHARAPVASDSAAARAPAAASAPAAAGSTAASSAPVAAADAGPDPGTLPQTRDKPEASGAGFDRRAAALWDAIVSDDPDRGVPAFFPVTAYEQVKGIPNPASDWRHRLVGNFKRDVHGLHKRLGDRAGDAKLVRLDVPEDRARWVEPGEESNKLGYWRVYGTHIVYELDGKERTFDVSSLISWRGEWYVVHLTGFK